MHVHPFTVGVENVISIIGTWLDCGWNAAGGGYAKVTMPCLLKVLCCSVTSHYSRLTMMVAVPV